MKMTLSLLIVLHTLLARAEQRLPWEDAISSPAIMDQNFSRNFDHLPLQGTYNKPQRLWSGYYWPFFKGGIDQRWFAKNQHQRNLTPPTRTQALKSSTHSLTSLSPAEKYDLYIGRYDYPVKRWSRSLIPNKAQVWEGICHGWSPASINHDEPRPRILKNPDGIEVPFSSADIKALLSFYYAFGFEVDNTHQMGRRCEANRAGSDETDCHQDLNAGAFHITLTNKIGILNQSFVMDTQRLREVWNNPVYSYVSLPLTFSAPLKDSAPHTVKSVRLKTKVTFVESTNPQWQTTHGSHYQKYKTNHYEYYLDLDVDNNIIGGKWISQERPDFIWEKRRPARYAGLLSEVGRLLYE